MKNNKELAVKIYYSRITEKLTFVEIGVLHSITPSQALAHYEYGKDLQGDYAWLMGLSPRAKNQIKRTKYRDFATLNHDISKGLIDLKDLHWIGPEVSREIGRWLKFPNDRRTRERRTQSRN